MNLENFLCKYLLSRLQETYMYLLYVMYRWVHMCLILMCQYYQVITILGYCITITYYSRVKNHVFLQKILLLCWCHFQTFIFLHDTKKIYFSFRGFPVQSIAWFTSSLCIHIWWWGEVKIVGKTGDVGKLSINV